MIQFYNPGEAVKFSSNIFQPLTKNYTFTESWPVKTHGVMGQDEPVGKLTHQMFFTLD